jgi:hypothetical protein
MWRFESLLWNLIFVFFDINFIKRIQKQHMGLTFPRSQIRSTFTDYDSESGADAGFSSEKDENEEQKEAPRFETDV